MSKAFKIADYEAKENAFLASIKIAPGLFLAYLLFLAINFKYCWTSFIAFDWSTFGIAPNILSACLKNFLFYNNDLEPLHMSLRNVLPHFIGLLFEDLGSDLSIKTNLVRGNSSSSKNSYKITLNSFSFLSILCNLCMILWTPSGPLEVLDDPFLKPYLKYLK